MSRPTNITKYDPKKSVHENASANGVTDAGMYYYIRTHNMSRTLAKANTIVKEIKKALKEDPSLSQAKVAEKTGHSVTTINKYWKAATEKDNPVRTYRVTKEPKVFEWTENIPEPKKQGHTLMSKRLATLKDLFAYADKLDVSGLHEFLFEHPEKPMLFIGNGGMYDHFASLLYGMNGGVAKSITPLEFASMSDAAIRSSRCMLLSVGGGNMDIKYAAKRALELNPDNTACYTNYMHDGSTFKRFEGTPARIFNFRVKRFDEGFISVENKFFRDAIMYRAFTGQKLSDLDIDISSEVCYRYCLNRSEGRITPLKKINHFIALYSDFGAPAAHDFESVLAETGVASAQVTDYRNFTHGRFLMMANHTKHSTKGHLLSDSDAAAVLFVTPRNKDLVQSIRDIALPTKAPIIIIETKYNDARAALDLLIKSNVFLADFEEKGLGINPCDPENYNSAEIDKRFPKNNVRFAQELKKYGPPTGTYISNSENSTKPKVTPINELLNRFKEVIGTTNENRPIDTTLEVEILDGIKFHPYEPHSYPKDEVVPFSSEAIRQNRVLGNHYNCIVKFRGVEFYGFEQLYSSLKFTHHPEVIKEIMAQKSAKQAKNRSHVFFRYYDPEHRLRHYRHFALCQLFKYLSVEEYRNRLRELRGITLVEHASDNDTHGGCIFNKKTNCYEGCNFSGRTTMAVRDMMLSEEDKALEEAIKKKGAELTQEERESVLQSVLDSVRNKFENLPQVRIDSDVVIDYIKNNGISLTRPPITKAEVDISAKALVLSFDNCLFDTSATASLRKGRKKDWDQIDALIPQYRLYDGWERVFNWAQDNNIKIGILSDNRGAHIKKAMDAFHLPYDVIIGKQARKGAKPNPYLGNLMLDKLQVIEENVLFVGNRVVDAKQAEISGFDFIGALWGEIDKGLQECGRTISSPEKITLEFAEKN